MRAVILVPRRPDGGRRDELWRFTQGWLETRHRYPIIVGDSHEHEGPFNRGRALNRAAALAGDWDVAIVHDGDNISNPDVLEDAVRLTLATKRTHYPHTVYYYLDEQASADVMAGGFPWLVPQPDRGGLTHSIRARHHSGVQVIPREAWEATGGFVELQGWGAEDSIMSILLDVFGGGQTWLRGAAYHLWHPHGAEMSPHTTRANRQVWRHVKTLQRRPGQLRAYLASLGHEVP